MPCKFLYMPSMKIGEKHINIYIRNSVTSSFISSIHWLCNPHLSSPFFWFLSVFFADVAGPPPPCQKPATSEVFPGLTCWELCIAQTVRLNVSQTTHFIIISALVYDCKLKICLNSIVSRVFEISLMNGNLFI